MAAAYYEFPTILRTWKTIAGLEAGTNPGERLSNVGYGLFPGTSKYLVIEKEFFNQTDVMLIFISNRLLT